MVKLLLSAGIISSLTLTACTSDKNSSTYENSNTTSEIIGGRLIEDGEKIQQSIVAVYDSIEGQLCTGSLLPNNLVLTAAHCLNSDVNAMYILFGSELSTESPQLAVDKMEVSPYWATNRFNDTDRGDIALLHFVGQAPEGFVPATFLSNNRWIKKNAVAVIAGYGVSDGVQGNGEGYLRTTSIAIEDAQFATSEVLLNQKSGTGACHGDSGGPVYIESHGKYYLWGIISRGVNDRKNDCSQFLGATKISAHRTWLNRMADKLSRSLTTPFSGYETR